MDQIEQNERKENDELLKLKCDKKNILGKGRYGLIFAGILDETNVAVKMVNKENVSSYEEDAIMKLCHPNVLQLLRVIDDTKYKYFVLELCTATFSDYFDDKYTGPLPRERDALMQMTDGLIYIHENGLVHRDLNPYNILIQQTSDETAVLKISEVGLCKPALASIKCNLYHIAPELILVADRNKVNKEIWAKTKGNVSSDIFALGYLFYGYLTKGKNPFITDPEEDDFIVTLNIRSGVHRVKSELTSKHFAYEAIVGMIDPKPRNRWGLGKVKKSITLQIEIKKKGKTETAVDGKSSDDCDIDQDIPDVSHIRRNSTDDNNIGPITV